MPVRFPCSSCGQLLGIGTRKIGTRIHCPNCRVELEVPDEERAALLRRGQRSGTLPTAETFDTPPEIAIPRERNEAFAAADIEGFLNQLAAPQVASKPTPQPAGQPNTQPLAKPAQPKQGNPLRRESSQPKLATSTNVAAPQIATTHPAAISSRPIETEVTTLAIADLLEVVEDDVVPSRTPVVSTIVRAEQPSAELSPKVAAAQAFLANQVVASASPSTPTTSTPIAHTAPSGIPDPPFADGVWISRRVLVGQVAILTVLTLAAFAVGWLSGGAGRSTGAGNGPVGPTMLSVRLRTMVADGKSVPDIGAAILVWPTNAKPLDKLSAKGLAPNDAAPKPDASPLKSLAFLGGAYGRCDGQGELLNLALPQPGEYYVLAISKRGKRPPAEEIKPAVLAQLGDLFGAEALPLLGDARFVLKKYSLAEQRTLELTLGAAEPAAN